MLDLLSQVRGRPELACIPFVPVTGESETSQAAIRGMIKDACLAEGADTFVDLIEMRQDLTWSEISSVLTTMIETAIGFRQTSLSTR